MKNYCTVSFSFYWPIYMSSRVNGLIRTASAQVEVNKPLFLLFPQTKQEVKKIEKIR